MSPSRIPAEIIVLLAVIVMSGVGSSLRADDPNFDDVIAKLKESQRKLINIKLTAISVVEKLDADGKTWKRTPMETEADVSLSGEPGGKGRIDFHKQVLEWVAGASPYSFTDYSVAFDGKKGSTFYKQQGAYNKPFPMHEGELSPAAPPALYDLSGLTGAHFSIYYWSMDKKQGLAELIESTVKLIAAPNQSSLTAEVYDQIPAVKIEFSGPRFSEKFWLDPARGYALLAHLHTVINPDGTTRMIVDDRINKLIEAAPGVWFPAEATSEYQRNKGCQRIAYTGSNIIANDNKFDESPFTITFPPGTAVNDKISRTEYKITP